MNGDKIIVYQSSETLNLWCKNSYKWVGYLILIVMAYCIYSWYSAANVKAEFSFWNGLILAGFIVVWGLGVALSEIETTFDLQSRVMEHRKTYAGGLYVTKQVVPFAQIEGVGLHRDSEESGRYAPVAVLRNGDSLSFVIKKGDHLQYQDVIAGVSAATGIALLPPPPGPYEIVA